MLDGSDHRSHHRHYQVNSPLTNNFSTLNIQNDSNGESENNEETLTPQLSVDPNTVIRQDDDQNYGWMNETEFSEYN